MGLLVLGLDHQTSPLVIRERLTCDEAQSTSFMTAVVPRLAKEAVLIVTCNRVELYAADPQEGHALAKALGEARGVPWEEYRDDMFWLEGNAVVRRLFSVASGLGSLVLGDRAILRQVRSAWHLSQTAGTSGPVLDALFQRALAAGRRARRAAGFDKAPRSVGQSAAELANRLLGTLADKTAVVVGCGESGEVTARGLRHLGVGRLLLLNRDRQRAETLAAKVGGEARPLAQLARSLAESDVAISTTGSPTPVVRQSDIGSRPIVLIDIAVPRDIDASVATLSNVRLFDIDGLSPVVDELDAAPAIAAKSIIDEEVEAFHAWRTGQVVVPAVRQLREHIETIGQTELDRALRRLGRLDERERAVVTELAHRIVQKVAHTPTVRLRAIDPNLAVEQAATLVDLFGIDGVGR